MGCTVVKRSDLGRPGQVRPRQPHTYPLGRASRYKPHRTPASAIPEPAPFSTSTLLAVAAVDLPGWRHSFVALGRFHEGHVVMAVGLAGVAPRPATSAERLAAAIGQVRCAMAVTQADTHGGRWCPPKEAWDELIALARPQIEAAVRKCRVPRGEFDDCVQQVWLEVVASIQRVDPRAARGNLICWLDKVARRTTQRLIRQQARAAGLESLRKFPVRHLCDPRQLDPSAEYAAREAAAILTNLIDSLSAAVSPEAQCLVERFLATDSPRLNSHARELGFTSGQLWHEWRKALAFLRERLGPENS